MNELKPTLWRTCRVLAHTTRLDLIRALLKNSPETVQHLAQQTGLAKSGASIYLRALNARGLIQAHPEGKFVYYSATPNPNVAHAAELLSALKRAINEGMSNKDIIHQATAFTHERRIKIVTTVNRRPLRTLSKINDLSSWFDEVIPLPMKICALNA